MLSISIKIYKCKRFPLLGQDLLEVNFDSNLMVVEGTNGSGKSSLFSMLTPLPCNKNDFYEGGYLKYKFMYGNDTYVATSDFSNKTPTYSLLRNDTDELNIAGIISTQRDLCYRIFATNDNVHDLLIGKENFTEMSFNARKKLFSTLTKLNIDHILKAYGKVNDKQNLNKLMLKNLNQQYKTEEVKLVTEEELNDIKQRLEETNKTIDFLLEMRANIGKYINSESNESSLNELKQDLKRREELLKNNYVLLTAYPKDTLLKRKESNKIKENVINNKLSDIYSKLEEHTKNLKAINAHESVNIVSLKEQINQRTDTINKMKSNLVYVKCNYTTELEASYYRIWSTLSETISSMGSNTDENGELIYTNKKLISVSEKYSELIKKKNDLMVEVAQAKDRENQLKSLSGNISCPSCNHVWSFRDSHDCQKNIPQLIEQIESIGKEIIECENYAKLCNSFFAGYKTIMEVKKETYGMFTEFWENVLKDHKLFYNPKSILPDLEVMTVDISSLKEIKEMEQGLYSMNEQVNIHQQFKGEHIRGVEEEVVKLNTLHIKLMGDKDSLRDENILLDKIERLYDTIENLDSSIRFNKERTREFNMTTVMSDIRSTIDNDIRDLKINAMNLSNIIHAQDNITYTLDKYKKSILDLEKEMNVVGILLTELSPKTGIIAKTISSFLNNIIENINNTLAVIWRYKMVLKPIDINTSDLNYRFAVEVEDKFVIDDINQVSRGMKEAINLSFKILIYKLLGLEKHILFLDELASNMDKHHTENISKLVHSFVTESDFSQVFIISHKENLNYLKDAQIITLD